MRGRVLDGLAPAPTLSRKVQVVVVACGQAGSRVQAVTPCCPSAVSRQKTRLANDSQPRVCLRACVQYEYPDAYQAEDAAPVGDDANLLAHPEPEVHGGLGGAFGGLGGMAGLAKASQA